MAFASCGNSIIWKFVLLILLFVLALFHILVSSRVVDLRFPNGAAVESSISHELDRQLHKLDDRMKKMVDLQQRMEVSQHEQLPTNIMDLSQHEAADIEARRLLVEPPLEVQRLSTGHKIQCGRLAIRVDLGAPKRFKSSALKNTNQDCYGACGGPGLCDNFCGFGNACCRSDFGPWDPPICKKAIGYLSNPHFHECVDVSTTFPDAAATVMFDDMPILKSPSKGMWSIGRTLQHGWPSDWDNGSVSSTEKIRIIGPWLVVEGAVETPYGNWLVKDQFRLSNGLVEGQREWVWTGEKPTSDSALSVAWTAVNASGNGLFLPGVALHGNPSGHLAGPGIPYWNKHAAIGEKLQVEEHRLAQPWVSFEWLRAADKSHLVAALEVQPSEPPYRYHPDLWWSLGAEAEEAGIMLQSLSGPLAFNSELGMAKTGAHQRTPFIDVGLLVPPSGRVQKRYRLHVGRLERHGNGFRIPLSWTLSNANLSPVSMPRVRDIVEAKVRFALSRWAPDCKHPGFGMYPGVRCTFTMGWAGQAEAPGYAFQVLANRMKQENLRTIAYEALETLSKSPFDEGGFKLELAGDSGVWKGQDDLSQGQAMNTFAHAIIYAKKTANPAVVSSWEIFLRRACEIHSARILDSKWRPRSTYQAFLIQPLAMSAKIFGNNNFLQAALKAGEHYLERHIGLTEPFWGGTLDASCEDKEGAWAGFQAFLALHEVTGDSKWLEAANYAADITLTYTYTWDVNMPPGPLQDQNLKTRGWTSVSVQNMHLDVYGVLYTPRLWRLGQLSHRPELLRVAELMFRSCGQMIDVFGSQGEQFQQTRYAQQGDMSKPDNFRGGYGESWTVFWIAAHFLTAAAHFEEMGVLSQLWDVV